MRHKTEFSGYDHLKKYLNKYKMGKRIESGKILLGRRQISASLCRTCRLKYQSESKRHVTEARSQTTTWLGHFQYVHTGPDSENETESRQQQAGALPNFGVES